MSSSQIGLVALNASYKHTAFGLRYLKANLKEYKETCDILEFTIHRSPQEIAHTILQKNYRIVGFGVYIWNTTEVEKVIDILRATKPELIIVIGGPEVSYETATQSICKKANHVICGEADFSFYKLCDGYLTGVDNEPLQIIRGDIPEIQNIELPYDLYTDEDIKKRAIYVEASRGCPYKCEYCLSSLDKGVRNFDTDKFLFEIEKLISRGARQFKFIDRTFNLSPTISTKILNFFLQKKELGLFLHFEMVPDRLPHEIRELIKQFPPGSLQFEIGIQTLNPNVAKNVSRNNDLKKVEENFKFLKDFTHVHTHADLIAGLPGENLQSFAAGFDQLLEWGPDEIQLGILKRLKGTPIVRHDMAFEMQYDSNPPFQALSTKDMDHKTLAKMTHAARYWDLIGNSGRFNHIFQAIRHDLQNENKSFFMWIWKLTDFFFEKLQRSHALVQSEIFKMLLDFCMFETNLGEEKIIQALRKDYIALGSNDIPKFLQKFNDNEATVKQLKTKTTLSTPKRQQHHQKNSTDDAGSD